jgi:uncharacterized protein (TIGR02145 family)
VPTDSEFCYKGAIKNRCSNGNKDYDPDTEFCYVPNGKVYTLCGGSQYVPTTHFCLGTVRTPLCDGLEYTSLQFCFEGSSGSSVENKCGNIPTGSEYALGEGCCGSNKYTIATQFCSGTTIYSKCGGNDYSPTTEQCCGSSKYTTATHYCKSGTTLTQYNFITHEGKTYNTVVIGEQTWMAENLNYAVAGSKCGTSDYYLTDDNTEYCNTYGRLYNWATAMGLGAEYDSASYSVAAKHKGVCPDGWHLPSNVEWDVLVQYVDPDWTSNSSGGNVAGTKLKAKSSWNVGHNYIPGTDEYGFSALPGGSGYFDGKLYDVGKWGYWWSTKNDTTYAYYRDMRYGNANVYRGIDGKSNFFSVRCLQD